MWLLFVHVVILSALEFQIAAVLSGENGNVAKCRRSRHIISSLEFVSPVASNQRMTIITEGCIPTIDDLVRHKNFADIDIVDISENNSVRYDATVPTTGRRVRIHRVRSMQASREGFAPLHWNLIHQSNMSIILPLVSGSSALESLPALLQFHSVSAFVLVLEPERTLDSRIDRLGFVPSKEALKAQNRSLGMILWKRMTLVNRIHDPTFHFVFPRDGDVLESRATYSAMTVSWRVGHAFKFLDLGAFTNDADDLHRREDGRDNTQLFARVIKSDSSSTHLIPVRGRNLLYKGRMTGHGKIFGTHAFAVQYVWKRGDGTLLPITSTIRLVFDVVISPEYVEAIHQPIFSSSSPDTFREDRVDSRSQKSSSSLPRVLILAEIGGFNGQLALYLEQCRQLTRDDTSGHVASIEWLSLSEPSRANRNAIDAQLMVKTDCDAHHVESLVLSPKSVKTLSQFRETDTVRSFTKMLRMARTVADLPTCVQNDLEPILARMRDVDVLVFENEGLRHIGELARLARIPVRILEITRPEYDADYSVQGIVASSSYVLTHTPLQIAAAKGIESRVVQPGVDFDIFTLDLFNSNLARTDVASSIDSPGRTFRIGFVGRLVQEKSPGLVLHALKALVKKWPSTMALDVDIVGGGMLDSELQSAAIRLGISTHIRWLGTRDHKDIPQLMSEWDVLLFPSVALETFGMVCIEAMAVGAIVINFGIGGTREFTIHGRTGLIADPMSGDGLADAILRVALNRVRAREMKRRAREFVRSRFTFEKYAARHAKMYRDLFKRHSN